MTAITLTQEQLQQLAVLIAAELSSSSSSSSSAQPVEALRKNTGSWLTAAQLADHLGVGVRFVYEHADELGATRLGKGDKPRLRFDLETAKQAMACSAGKRSEVATPSVPGTSQRLLRVPGADLPIRVPLSQLLAEGNP